jgi:hypothetical protein
MIVARPVRDEVDRIDSLLSEGEIARRAKNFRRNAGSQGPSFYISVKWGIVVEYLRKASQVVITAAF